MMRELLTLTNAQPCGNRNQTCKTAVDGHAEVGLAKNNPCGRVAVNRPHCSREVGRVQNVRNGAGSAAIVEPGLNPNHPSHRIRQPSVAEVML